jgi:hypothetical protein
MLNYDVVGLICAEIEIDYTHSRRKSDLRSLGLVSKNFLEPALDALWKNMSSIEPLLSVFPEATLVNGQKVRVEASYLLNVH